MATCPGKYGSNNSYCGATVYKCTKCGAVGCSKPGCSNQKFSGGRCLSCGSNGTSKSV